MTDEKINDKVMSFQQIIIDSQSKDIQEISRDYVKLQEKYDKLKEAVEKIKAEIKDLDKHSNSTSWTDASLKYIKGAKE